MQNIELMVAGRTVKPATFSLPITEESTLTDSITAVFDTEWEGLAKSVTFSNGETVIMQDYSDGMSIPWEVMQKPGKIWITFTGMDASGKVLHSARMAHPLPVVDVFPISGLPPEPSPSWGIRLLPMGGEAGQVLGKLSDDDYAVGWVDAGEASLQPATADRLGGVKIGDGVSVEDDGTISVEEVTKESIGLGNVANVLQYSAENEPPYPVSSVNGKTGAVSLSASDVGADIEGAANEALEAATEALEAHVGDVDNPHMVDKVQVGLWNVDNVKQYSASNEPPYPVTSVNGKSGAVALTPSDLGIGAVFKLKGSVDRVGDLPEDGNEIGDVYYVEAEAVGYIWLEDSTGERWEQLGVSVDLSSYVKYVVKDDAPTDEDPAHIGQIWIYDDGVNKSVYQLVGIDEGDDRIVYDWVKILIPSDLRGYVKASLSEERPGSDSYGTRGQIWIYDDGQGAREIYQMAGVDEDESGEVSYDWQRLVTSGTLSQYVPTSAVKTTISSTSTDDDIPTAKAVWSIVGNVESALTALLMDDE